jgi:hypothetical protein
MPRILAVAVVMFAFLLLLLLLLLFLLYYGEECVSTMGYDDEEKYSVTPSHSWLESCFCHPYKFYPSLPTGR